MSEIKLWEILVPCQRNDGKPYRTRHHRGWDAQVLRITGGLTILKPTTAGYWIDQRYEKEVADVYKDRMIPVRIAATNEQMEEIIKRTLVHYDQEAIFCYVISTEVRVTYRDEINGKTLHKQ